MNRKWSSEKVKQAQRWIVARWPESFSQGPDLRPLSLNIHKEILAHRDESELLSSRVVSEVLKRHTTSFGYLYGMLKTEHRYDLDNKPVGVVTVEQRNWARSTLRQKQKLLQKINKEKKQLLSAAKRKETGKTASKEHDPVKHSQSVSSASPVIRYKPARRKIVKPAAERAVDLAS